MINKKRKDDSQFLLMDAKDSRTLASSIAIQKADFDNTDGWTKVTIAELCEEDRTLVEPTSEMAARLPYLSLEHVESVTGNIFKELSGTVEDEGRSVTFHFDSRHVLYGRLRPYLNKVALPDFEGRCTTEMIPLLPRSGVSRDFLAWILRRPQTVKAAMQEKTGARMPRANMNHVLSLAVHIPHSIEEQKRIADFFSERLVLITEAKKACHEQIGLLDAYTQKVLASFPTSTNSPSSLNKG